jgi:hypothetical protein
MSVADVLAHTGLLCHYVTKYVTSLGTAGMVEGAENS